MNECVGKMPYGSYALADVVRRRMDRGRRDRQRHKDWGPMPKPYRCDQCGKWHLGNGFGLETDGKPVTSLKFKRQRRVREDPLDTGW